MWINEFLQKMNQRCVKKYFLLYPQLPKKMCIKNKIKIVIFMIDWTEYGLQNNIERILNISLQVTIFKLLALFCNCIFLVPSNYFDIN